MLIDLSNFKIKISKIIFNHDNLDSEQNDKSIDFTIMFFLIFNF